MKVMKQRRLSPVVAGALIVAAILASYATGVAVGHQDNHAYSIGGTPMPADLQAPLDDLWQAYQVLNSDSYWRPFDHKQLLYGAVNGLLQDSHAGDTHTIFLPPANSHYQTQVLNEALYGIGAQVSMTAGGLLIDAPYFDSPAMKAGLQAGDVITGVNGKNIRGLSATIAVTMIHGTAGSTVRLTVVRKGRALARPVPVIRGSIPTVLISNNGPVGYLGFTEFGQNTANEVHSALLRLLGPDHVKYLVLDLRGNPGGYVTTARSVASEFLPRGSVIWWDRANLGGARYQDHANMVIDPGIAQHIPTVVLVDGNTASAAEILTAALRENGRAHVVGTITYGKGSEQESITLADGSGLRVTTSLWLTPKKHEVNLTGITPDVLVNRQNGALDDQLRRAVQYVVSGH
jgi:carboxyl-terminal processing protease